MSVVQQVAGVVLTAVSLWPMSAALDAVARHDGVGGLLLLGVTWVVARSGVELVLAAQAPRERKP